MMNRVRLRIDNDIEILTENSFKMFSDKYDFCKYFGISLKTYRGWFWKDCGTIPFEFIKSACKLNEINVWDFLDGKEMLGQTGGKGGRSRLIFRRNIMEKLSNTIGWLLSDGHINKSGRRINFSQKEVVVLDKIIKDLNRVSILEKLPCIKPNGDTFFFEINSSPLGFIFTKYLNLPFGKRSNFEIPKIIWMGNDESKFAFLAGVFEGDGTFTSENGMPIIHLEMNDLKFVTEIRDMLIKLGFHPTKISPHRDCFSFSLSRKNEVLKFMKKIRQFIKHPKTFEFLLEYGVAS